MWLKAILGGWAGAVCGAGLAFAGWALVVMRNGGWQQSEEKFIVGVLVYDGMTIVGASLLGGVLGILAVISRQK